MCGIAGILSYGHDAGPVDVAELVDVREAMAARGPDGAGLWVSNDRRIGLAHRRLAIIDLSDAGAQPMLSNDGALVITYNGELYNYRELRKELVARGHPFSTQSDTEVLLALYREVGEDMVHRLRGMYAFAIWDHRRQSLLAARDPFGIKPFYYADNGRVLRFASQVKALVKGEGIRLTPNPAGHVGFFVLGHVPDPHTLHREIRALPAGWTLQVNRGSEPRLRRFYDLAQRVAEAESRAQASGGEGQWPEMISAALRDSVRHHLISDVPVGVFLSSGFDSNVIATMASAESARGLIGVTLGFHDFLGTEQDEIPLAAKQAAALGIRHSIGTVSKEEFYDNLGNIWSAMDQPSIDGLNSWLVAKVAADAGLKVCLSGLGGDELFGGYPSFRQVPKLVHLLSGRKIPPAAEKLWRHVIRRLPERWISPKYSGLFSLGRTLAGAYLLRRGLFLADELASFLDPQMVDEGVLALDLKTSIAASTQGVTGDHAAIAAMEVSWYMRNQLLRDTDWASMAHGLEVRTPYIDTNLVEALLPMIVSRPPLNKAHLARAAGSVLSQELRNRPKTGFTTPVHEWIRSRHRNVGRYRGLRGWARLTYSEFVPEISLSRRDVVPARLSERRPIIVYRIGQLGDAVIALPALHALRREYPDTPLVLLTNRHASNSALVSAWDVIGPTVLCDGVIFYDVSTGTLANWRTYIALARALRLIAPQEIVNIAPRRSAWDVRRDWLFFRVVCGAPAYRSVRPDDQPKRPCDDALKREPEWLRLLRAVAPSATSSAFELRIPRWAHNEAESALSALSQYPRLVAVAPGSKMPAKRWPTERYKQVGRQILSKDETSALVAIGGREDQRLGEELQQAWGARSLNLCGQLSVFGSAAVLRRCESFIGNDSGAMHLAGLAGIPCIALFSARDLPGKWAPLGDHNRILRKNVECAGCMLEVCDKDNLCLAKIEVHEVVEAWGSVSSARTH